MLESILFLKLHRPKKHKLQHRLNSFWLLHICKIAGLIFTYKLWINADGLNTTALSRLKGLVSLSAVASSYHYDCNWKQSAKSQRSEHKEQDIFKVVV
jgi:hypothetical protein